MIKSAKKLTALVLAALVLTAMSRPASAGQITSLSSSGPGGTVSYLAIATAGTPDDSIAYAADFTSVAPITIAVTVNGSGQYDIGYPVANVTNSTSVGWPTFDISLSGIPAGSTLNGYEYNEFVYQTGTYSPPFPNATTIEFSGSGLSSGQTTILGASFYISAAATFDITLSPLGVMVPEPSTFALASAALVILAPLARKRFRI